MATNLEKVEIKTKNPAFPTKKLLGINREGKVTDQYDFFKDSIKDDWWEFFLNTSTPNFNDEDISYTIAVKSTYTCTGTDAELISRKAEYLKIGLEELFKFYSKDYDTEILNQFMSDTDAVTGKQISSVIDYHLGSRPSSKLKFLIEVDARYLNALPSKAAPLSFSENLDSDGNLITSAGLLNPTMGDDGNFKSYDDISIMTISSATGRGGYETELEKTSFYMSQLYRDMISASIKIRGLNILNEAKRLRLVAPAIQDLIAYNFSIDGYSSGENTDQRTVPLPLTGENYNIRIAFRDSGASDADGKFEILWATVPDENGGDILLKNGFERFKILNPLDDQTTLRYFYFHQQILNNLDRNVELTFVEFVTAYHYPQIDVAGLLSQTQREIPLADVADKNITSYGVGKSVPYFIETDPNRVFEKPRKQCGFKFPDLPNFELSFLDLLQQLLEPVNFQAELKLTFFAIGPPCPTPFTGDTLPAILKESGQKLKNKILNQKKVLDKMEKDAEESFDYIGEYFTSEEYVNDLEKRFANPSGGFLLKMRQLGDMVLNQIGLEKLLKLVCICITQYADDLLAAEGIELQVPTAAISLKGPGVSFDPSLLTDDSDENFNMKQAFDANWGQFNMPVGLKPFQLQQLCSFCITLPDILPKFPTFDMLKNMIDLLLSLLEALLVQILMQLVLSLLKWLTRCPDFQCELRPAGAAADDYGNVELPDFFPDEGASLGPNSVTPMPPILANCPALFGIAEATPDLDAIQEALFERISEELSSGELLNVLEGYPSNVSVNVIKEIIDTEEQFSDIRPFISSYAKVEALIDCIFDNADPAKVASFEDLTKDPEYCPDPNNNPAVYMRDKCDNEDQIKRFLLRESTSKAAKLKGIIDALRVDPDFFSGLFPDIFSSTDPETNEKKSGLLSEDKFKPPVVDTLIEQYDPFINNINRTARQEGASVLNSIYQDGHPNHTIPSDKDLETHSILQLAGAVSLATLGVTSLNPILVMGASALTPNNQGKKINTKYPIVGGTQLRQGLLEIEKNSNYSILKNEGTSAKFSGLNIPNKNLRQFNGSVSVDYLNGQSALELYFESITDTLKTSGDNNGFKNNIVVRAKSPNLFNSQGFVAFSYEAPLNLDEDSQLEVLDPVIDLGLLAPSQLQNNEEVPYSPQGFVFAQLVEKGSQNIFNSMIPGIQDKFIKKLASSVHLTAFRDFVGSIAKATQDSPYFTTYTYEEINSGVGSEGKITKNFKRFGRRNPYNTTTVGIGDYDFGQYYDASDSNNRTSVLWPPTPAIQDTPLRDGRYENGDCVEYIPAEEMKQKIKDNWSWEEQYDPSDTDPNNLPPLSNAILDELIPQTIKFYCVDAAIKSMPVSKIYGDSDAKAFRDEMYATIIAELILREIDYFPLKNKFLTQVNKYWERRYKEDEDLNVLDAPKNLNGIKILVSENIGEAINLASNITNIKHLDEDAEKLQFPSSFIIEDGTSTDKGLVFVPNLRFDHPDNAFGSPPVSDSSSYNKIPQISKGGFILEAFFEVDLYDDMREWVIQHIGQEFLDNLINVPLSPDTLENGILLDSTDQDHILKNFLAHVSVKEQNSSKALPDNYKNITQIVGPIGTGLFKDIKFGLRLSYSITENGSVENFFNDILAQSDAFAGLFETLAGKEVSEPLMKEVIKNKSFIFSEDDNKILSFPIITKKYTYGSTAINALLDSSFETLPTAKVVAAQLEAGMSEPSNAAYTAMMASDVFPTLPSAFSGTGFEKNAFISSVKNESEWKALFRYSLSEGLASNIVSLYSYLNLLEGTGSKKTFKGTKALLKLFFISATTKAGMDGKPAGGEVEFDMTDLQPDDTKPSPLDENGSPTEPETPDDNKC
jgi:hypothetical protein